MSLVFGDVIKNRRELFNLSIRGAAKQMGISYAQLSDLENGISENPTAKTLNGMRVVYRFKAESLLDMLMD